MPSALKKKREIVVSEKRTESDAKKKKKDGQPNSRGESKRPNKMTGGMRT